MARHAERRLDLLRAIAHKSACEIDDMGVQLAACASHRLLISDQRALDGLLFARRILDRLNRREFELGPRAIATIQV